MKKLIKCAIALAMLPSTSFCDDVLVPDAAGNLNDDAFWSDGKPAAGDVAVWDSGITGSRATFVGADPLNPATVDFTVAGLRFGNDLNFAIAPIQTVNGAGALELGASGIAMNVKSTAASPFNAVVNAPIRLTANQAWDNSGAGVAAANCGNNFTINGPVDADGNAINFTGAGGFVTFNNSYNFDGFTHSMLGNALVDAKTIDGGLVRFSNLGSFGSGDIALAGNSRFMNPSGGVEFFGGGEFVIGNEIYFTGAGKHFISQDSSLTLNGDIFHNSGNADDAFIGLFVSGTNAVGGADNVATVNSAMYFNNSHSGTRGTGIRLGSGARAVMNGSIYDAPAATRPQPATFEGAGGARSRVELRAPNYHTGGTSFGSNIHALVMSDDALGSGRLIFSGPAMFEVADHDRVYDQDVFLNSTSGSGSRMTIFTGTNNITFTGPVRPRDGNDLTLESSMAPDKTVTFSGDFTFADVAADRVQNLHISSTAGVPDAGFFRLTGNIRDGATGAGRFNVSYAYRGHFELSGDNSFSGGIILDSGGGTILRIGSNTALGTGPITFGHDQITIGTVGEKNLVLNNKIRTSGSSGNGTLVFEGGNGLEFTGAYENSANLNRTFSNKLAAGKKLVFSGPDFMISTINATGNITHNFNGGGTIVINSNIKSGSDRSDAVNISDAGTVLVLNGANTYTNATTANTGATLAGSGSLAGPAVINGGATLHPQAMTFNDGIRFNVNGTKTMAIGYYDLAVVANHSVLTWADNSGRSVTINLLGDWKFSPGSSMLLFDLSDGTIANAAHLGFTNFTHEGEETTRPLSLEYDDGLLSGRTPGIYIIGGLAYIPREPTQIIIR